MVKKMGRNLNRRSSREDIQMANRYKLLNITYHQEMQIKITMKYHLKPEEWLLSKRQEITSVRKNVEKRKPLCPVGGSVSWCTHYGKQSRGSSKN